jgi:hypothetical protein
MVDSELIRIDYAPDGSTTAKRIADERYIGRYINNQKEITARIHIVTASAFSAVLPEYSALHECNAQNLLRR